MRIVRLVTAFDCGAVVNPDDLRNQIEFEAVEFENGRILNNPLSNSRWRDTVFSVPVKL